MKIKKNELTSTRLRFRKPLIEDAKTLFEAYATNVEVTKYLLWKPHRDIAETESFLTSCIEMWDKGESYNWIIEKKGVEKENEAEAIGMIRLEENDGHCNIGYVLKKSEWNKGYMTEALGRMIDFLFKETDVAFLKTVCDIDNASSSRIMQKSNMTYKGILEKHMIFPNISEEPRDCHSYEITKDEYIARCNVLKLIPNTEIRNWVGNYNDKKTFFDTGIIDAKRYIDLGEMKRNDRVLDLGCGCGRMAMHLADYLTEGTYTGVDNSPALFDWCNTKIAPALKNTSFQFVDIFNGAYNAEGKINPCELKIDIEDVTIDQVIAHSLFTHMFFDDIRHYFDEIRRVLKPGGKFISSYYLINERSLDAMKKANSAIDFRYQVGTHSKTKDRQTPEEGIAHSEEKLLEIYSNAGFIDVKIFHGKWVDKSNQSFDDVQDLIVSVKQ